MTRHILSAVLALSIAGIPALVGCDRTVEHDRSVDVKDDGTTVKKDKKVTENSDGSVTKTESKDVSKP